MLDIKTVWIPAEGRGDYVLAGADLLDGDDLETAVLISLFSDRQADLDDELPPGVTDRRGWWADTQADKIGSKLWLRERSKGGPELPNRVRRDILAALQWLIDDDVAQAVDAAVAWIRTGVLGARVVITRRDGRVVTLKYDWAWTSLMAA